MSVITQVDKQGKFITYLKDGELVKQEVRPIDTVISFPPTGSFRKITNIYVEPISGKLVVIHEEGIFIFP